ncbi:MAG: DUF1150 family protein [Rhodobacteraceae bacterium]|nr:DUF1150 family protein [Paracoccaceae bacterium]
MKTKLDLRKIAAKAVYVKPVAVADLPDELQDQAGGRETLFAVHNSEGRQLALVADCKLAFALARHHDMEPMTLH